MSESPNNQTLEKDWKTVFLACLQLSPNVAKAARAAGVNRSYTYEARKADPVFATSWDDVIEESMDDLEDEMFKRAKCDSDTLAIFLAKAHRPEKYREKVSAEVTGKDGSPLVPHSLRVVFVDAPERTD